MPACTSISDSAPRSPVHPRFCRIVGIIALSLAFVALGGTSARADESSGGANGAPPADTTQGAGDNGASPSPSTQDRTTTPEEDDYTGTPYTEYGEFNEEKSESETNRFFEYGRLFGVSVGLGVETADGNRGTLYQGGFPTFDFKLHYWFNFHFAMDMDFTYAEQYFITSSSSFSPGSTTANPVNVRYNVNLMRLGLDVKYYFDTKNLSAAISFANPYIIVGAGTYSKSESSATGVTSQTDTENAIGFNAGGGLEFALDPRAVYLTAEAKIHLVQFADYNTNAFAQSEGLPDQHGNFYTFIMSVLFTW